MNELDELLEIIDVAPADPATDVARGERALRRRRGTQVSAAALSVAAVVAVGLAVHDASGSPHAAGFAGGPGGGQTASDHRHQAERHAVRHLRRAERRDAQHLLALQRQQSIRHTQGVLRSYHDVLAQHLDPHGDLLAPPSNEQGGGGTLGSKFDWNHGGMLEIVVGPRWDAAGSFYQLETAGMTPTTYDGHPARVSTTGSDLVVSVQHDDGTVVTLVASNGFGNNGTSTSSLDLTDAQLLAAASDQRLTLPHGLGG